MGFKGIAGSVKDVMVDHGATRRQDTVIIRTNSTTRRIRIIATGVGRHYVGYVLTEAGCNLAGVSVAGEDGHTDVNPALARFGYRHAGRVVGKTDDESVWVNDAD